MGKVAIAPLPQWVAELVRASSGGSGARMEPSELAGLLSGVREGGRHDAATRLAGHFLGKRLAPDVVEVLLLDWNRKNGPPLPDGEVSRAVADLARKDATKPERPQGEPMKEQPDPTPCVLSLRTLDEILSDPDAMKEPEPVVPRLAWEGRSTLFAGREKLGKSTLAAAGAAATSDGARFLGEFGKAGPVLWVGLEEHVGDTAHRFQTFQANRHRIYLLDRLENPFADLCAAVEQTGAVLVVVDTLAAFAETLVDDPHNSSKWTPVMARLTRLARDTGAAVLLLHHARKSDGKYRDSTAIGAGVDYVLELHPGEEASVRKLTAKGRRAVENISVRLEGDRYTLTAGELSMDARVLLFVDSNPGCSLRALRGGVSGNNEAKDKAVLRLLKIGALEDRGDGASRQLFPKGWAHPPAESVPAEKQAGTRAGTVSGHAAAEDRAHSENPMGTDLGTVPEPLFADLATAATNGEPEDAP